MARTKRVALSVTLCMLLLIVVAVCMANIGAIYAEEQAPSEPQVEQPSEEKPPIIKGEDNLTEEQKDVLNEKLGFLDEPIRGIVINCIGVLVGCLIMLIPVLKGAKKVKVAWELFNEKRGEADKEQLAAKALSDSAKEMMQEVQTFKEDIIKLVGDNTATIEKVKEMVEVGFCSDANLIASGQADKIKLLSGVYENESQN